MDKQLEQSIAELYRVFARYPLNRRMRACPCCVDDGHFKVLFAGELRALEPKQLKHFARKAATTWGTRDDYCHFLPRILELVAWRTDDMCFEPWLQARKLEYTHWRSWPQTERRAVANFWYSLFNSVVQAVPVKGENYGASGVAEAIATLGLDLEPVLREWEKAGNTGALHLADAVADLDYYGHLPGEWCSNAAVCKVFENWLRDDERMLQLQAAESHLSGDQLVLIRESLHRLSEFPRLRD